MNPHIKNLSTHLANLAPESAMEMLYEYYRDINIPETEIIKVNFSCLNDILGKLPLQEMDEVWYRVCDLCIEYQKRAFLDGVSTGAKLAVELEA